MERRPGHEDSHCTDWITFCVSGGFVILFLVASFVDIDFVASCVNQSSNTAAEYFGGFWQVLLLATFIGALLLAASPAGRIRLGKLDKPELSTFKWTAIIMCTLLAGGGVFWSAAEPIYHFTNVPPIAAGIANSTSAAIVPALSQSFLHWGFSAWAILGTLSAVVFMYAHYHRGMPFKPRSLLYPLVGEHIRDHWIGGVVDAFSIVAVAAGTIGPIGFLGLQLGFFLNKLFGIPNTLGLQLAVVGMLVVIYTISAATGVYKGIQLLSSFNVILAVLLMAAVLVIGPTRFLFDSFLTSFGSYVQDFVRMSLYRGNGEWLRWWTVFFWGWFIGYAPMMTLFVARISRGRTIREIILTVAVIAPVIANFWFTLLGGTGIFYELETPGAISGPLGADGLPAALLAIITHLPASSLLVPLFLVLIVVFLATTGDSMAYSIAMVVSNSGTPPRWVRVFWAMMMGAIAAALLAIGDSGISALQSFIVATAVPVGVLMASMLWAAPKAVAALREELRPPGS
jgi:choline/carnitine/betaine transport